MKCSDCGAEIIDDEIAYCEKCENYYCMDCCNKHNGHGLIFYECINGELSLIDVGISGAGGIGFHKKLYADNHQISLYSCCNHAIELLEDFHPVFFCEDRIIRCSKCFFKSEFTRSDPILKVAEDKYMWLLPHTYDPYNLKLTFSCENNATKGQYINSKIFIENNKGQDIMDITIFIEAFANSRSGDVFNEYRHEDSSRYLICEEINYDLLKSKDSLDIPIKIKIPSDYEIKEYDFMNLDMLDDYYDVPKYKELLSVPNDLKIYVHFTYKTVSKFEYVSYVVSEIVKLE